MRLTSDCLVSVQSITYTHTPTMNHAAQYCKTLRKVTKAELINALHSCLMQLNAQDGKGYVLDNKPAIAQAGKMLGKAGHPGFDAQALSKFSYQGSDRTRFGFYGPASDSAQIVRHEFATRRERDDAFRAAKQSNTSAR